MTGHLKLPDSPQPDDRGRLFAPSAARNAPHIERVIYSFAPNQGDMLELASGTGEHAVHMARAFPNLTWQPSDIDPVRLTSIQAHSDDANLPNLRDPITLDATINGWGKDHQTDMVLLVNLLHLIPETAAKTIIQETSQALNSGGIFIIYGPFMRAGELISDGDLAFHQSLINQDPKIGYKDDFDVIDWLHDAWFQLEQVIEMPSNNLSIVARKY